MNVDRSTLMFYLALVGAFAGLAAGFLFDLKNWNGSATAFMVIAVVAGISLFMTYLSPSKE